jgi:hypothetical protein
VTSVPGLTPKWSPSRRNRWSPSIGIGGHVRLEPVVTLPRNTQAWVWNETAAGYAVPMLVLIGLLVRPGGIAQGMAHEIR